MTSPDIHTVTREYVVNYNSDRIYSVVPLKCHFCSLIRLIVWTHCQINIHSTDKMHYPPDVDFMDIEFHFKVAQTTRGVMNANITTTGT